MTEETKDPGKLAAEIELIKAQTRKANLEVEKEQLNVEERKMAVDEARRSFESIRASNQENRIYDLIGAIGPTSVEQCVNTLSRWSKLSVEPITIRITSPGGSVFDGLTLFDYILALREEGIEVNTIVFGMAASMATVLAQAGKNRIVAPNAQMMIHEMEVQFPSAKVSEAEDQNKSAKRLNDRLFEILSQRAKISKTEIVKRSLKKDWWLNAQEAKDLGFCDEIGFKVKK